MSKLIANYYKIERKGIIPKKLKYNKKYNEYTKELKKVLEKLKSIAPKEVKKTFLKYDELITQIESLENKEYYIEGHKDAAGF